MMTKTLMRFILASALVAAPSTALGFVSFTDIESIPDVSAHHTSERTHKEAHARSDKSQERKADDTATSKDEGRDKASTSTTR